MKVEISTLCEYASEHLGQLTIVDTFDAIFALKFPWRAYFHFAAKINLEETRNNYQKITMKIVKADESQEKLIEVQGAYKQIANAEKMNLVAGLKGLIFNSPGEYKFQVFFDGDMIVDHSFRLILKDGK